MAFLRKTVKTLLTQTSTKRKRFDFTRYMKQPGKSCPFTFGIKGAVETPHQNYYYGSIGEDFDLYYIGGRMLVLARNWSLMNDFIGIYWGKLKFEDVGAD